MLATNVSQWGRNAFFWIFICNFAEKFKTMTLEEKIRLIAQEFSGKETTPKTDESAGDIVLVYGQRKGRAWPRSCRRRHR